jgi:uncharacterized OB-fold protein
MGKAVAMPLSGRRCPSCGKMYIWAPVACRNCGHTLLEDCEFDSRGIVYAVAEVSLPPLGLESESPYKLVMVDLYNGPRVLARYPSKNSGYENVQIGKTVHVWQEDGIPYAQLSD